MADLPQNIFSVILAAGSSSRFGTTKQTVRLNDVPLVRRAIDTAARACDDRVITVIGHDGSAVLRAMNGNSGFVVVNEDYGQGLGSSIAVAARACRHWADALLLLLADQALVTPDHLLALLDNWSGSDTEIVATAYDDVQGPPVLMPRATFDDLCQLDGDTGARALFGDDRFQLKTVRFEPAAIDIDTPADLAALT
jgi:molybdenum cofactor cytidylyltransferase